MSHRFVTRWSTLEDLSYELLFVNNSERIVCLPAPLLVNYNARNGWSFSEDELNAYLEEHGPRAEPAGGQPEEDYTQSHTVASSSYQYYDFGASSSQDPPYDDAPGWNPYGRF